jgi:hypothetical protein
MPIKNIGPQIRVYHTFFWLLGLLYLGETPFTDRALEASFRKTSNLYCTWYTLSIKGYYVGKISDIGGFVRIGVHKAHGF